MLYLDVSDCNMEEGSLRVDANVSVRKKGVAELGTKTEVKNLNSFRFLQKALAYEVGRQIEVLESGGEVQQETRLFDSREQRTYGMRSKEFAHDYRYFPEPDLLPLIITDDWKEEVRKSLPELPGARESRFLRDYDLPAQDAALLAQSRTMADYFEETVKRCKEPKLAANWILNDLTYLLQENGKEFLDCPVPSPDLADLIALVNKGTISGKMAKDVLAEMFRTGKSASQIVGEKGLEQITDPDKIATIARQIIGANPKQTEQYRKGKTATLGWFVGQVMKATRGQANPQMVQEVLKKELS
jgi:aspartyl-tRNA(Asn)/glutamyl-tRNA(Gln) amidotransferase subunit B